MIGLGMTVSSQIGRCTFVQLGTTGLIGRIQLLLYCCKLPVPGNAIRSRLDLPYLCLSCGWLVPFWLAWQVGCDRRFTAPVHVPGEGVKAITEITYLKVPTSMP